MNFYPHHIGDYRSATAHLSNEEDLAYRRLLEMYYDTECAIPAETQWVSRRLRLGTQALATVLEDFFFLLEDGWHHARCDREIAEYNKKADIARANGKKGGRRKSLKSLTKNPAGSSSVATENPAPAQALANQEPGTINQEPKKEKTATAVAATFALPEWINQVHWTTWHSTGKRRHATAQQKDAAVAKLRKWRDAGQDHAGALENAAIGGWQGLFLPKESANQARVESPYARTMREKVEALAPSIAARNPSLAPKPLTEFFEIPEVARG